MPQRLLLTFAVFSIAAALFVGLTLAARANTAGEPTAQPEAQAGAGRVVDPEEALNVHEEWDVTQTVSYAIGYDLGRSFQAQQIELDAQQLWAGLQAGLGEVEPELSDEQVQQVLVAFQQQLREQALEQHRAEAERHREQGEQFLEANRDNEGVMETDSGLQFRVIEPGEGASPGPRDVVVVHYTGRFIDGGVFDSSRERGQPARFPVNQVIPGWTEGLQLMQAGGRYELFVPSDLAYGDQGRGDMMPPNATLIFDIELLDVRPVDE